MISLFTKISVDLAIMVAQERLHKLQNLNELTKWSVNDICNDLQICLEATYLTFQKNFFKQICGTAMGSPVSVVEANLVNNSQILEFETDYRKRQFIESFFINDVPNTMNDRESISLPFYVP